MMQLLSQHEKKTFHTILIVIIISAGDNKPFALRGHHEYSTLILKEIKLLYKK